jgi:mono/diheme cytochrome c family protein
VARNRGCDRNRRNDGHSRGTDSSDAAGTAQTNAATAEDGAAAETRKSRAGRQKAGGSRIRRVRAAGNAAAARTSAVQVSSDPNVHAGAALYRKNGCYECHVNDGQGGPQGPRLGPNPIPLPRFVAYVRNPAGDMPPFTAKVVSDDDLAKIYAFLQSRPTPPQVKDIPLLAP